MLRLWYSLHQKGAGARTFCQRDHYETTVCFGPLDPSLYVLAKSYRVHYKNDLRDAVWEPLNGQYWVEGNSGYFRDLKPRTAQRFYRVTSD